MIRNNIQIIGEVLEKFWRRCWIISENQSSLENEIPDGLEDVDSQQPMGDDDNTNTAKMKMH